MSQSNPNPKNPNQGSKNHHSKNGKNHKAGAQAGGPGQSQGQAQGRSQAQARGGQSSSVRRGTRRKARRRDRRESANPLQTQEMREKGLPLQSRQGKGRGGTRSHQAGDHPRSCASDGGRQIHLECLECHDWSARCQSLDSVQSWDPSLGESWNTDVCHKRTLHDYSRHWHGARFLQTYPLDLGKWLPLISSPSEQSATDMAKPLPISHHQKNDC